MNTLIPDSVNLEFYVADIRRHDTILLGRNLNLPQALALYECFPTDRIPALGAMLGTGINVELVRRVDGHSALVTDYQNDDLWRYNRDLCVSAINMIVCTLHIRHQMKANASLKPLQERVHVLQLKDDVCFTDLRFIDTDWLKANGQTADINHYSLVFSEDVQPGFTPEGLFIRYNSGTHPEGYRGHSLSVSDVLVYQNHKGSNAFYIDKVGCTPLRNFVKAPARKEQVTYEKRNDTVKEARR